jgi:superoxide dismutase, Fe-Mn family
MITRRQAIKMAALGAVLTSTANVLHSQAQPAASAPAGPFALPKLPYAADALEPHIDARTMEIHHTRHHAAYVNNLNKALADHPQLANRPLEELIRTPSALPENIRNTVRNNGGGHFNHALFWEMMSPKGGGQPRGPLAQAIERKFGSFDQFKEQLSQAAMGQFGSGWAWLTIDGKGELGIRATANQDSPVMQLMDPAMEQRYGLEGRTTSQPLLGVDVWEHAYYLKYQNRRADYVAAFFNVVNWDYVADRYQKFAR